MRAVVFTPYSISQLARFDISVEWFSEYFLPTDAVGLKRIVLDDIVYIIESSLEDDICPLVAINLETEYAVFSPSKDNALALERIRTVSDAQFSTSVKIPPPWRPYGEHSMLSIYAGTRFRGQGGRINFDLRPNGRNDLFAFAHTDEAINFASLSDMSALHKQIRNRFVDAILTTVPPADTNFRAGLELAEVLPQGFRPGASLQQWYDSMLTTEQRRFVDKEYDGPVRLRGVAGTGKTVSLAIKLLRDGNRFEAEKKRKRLCFVSHSAAATDLVRSMAENLDPMGLLYGNGKYCEIEIRTLYDLAQEFLGFELKKLQPLSLDGAEGRTLQKELIESALKEMWQSTIIQARFSDLSESIRVTWERAVNTGDGLLISELMNEFASVLDAENIRVGDSRGEKYITSSMKRPAWLMPLNTEQDRRFILEVHRRYRSTLREMNIISVDQMVADFNNFLDSNMWDQVRERSGYDALFIDELHLFNAMERQTLHKLMCRILEEENNRPVRPALFMAYDLKQSTSDSFTQYGEPTGSLFTISSGLQNSDLIQLDTVFRYTPQITDFLKDLDATFPAIDIPEEWEAYSGTTKLGDGPKPELCVYADDKAQLKTVMAAASELARTIRGGGRRVAVLCPSADVFDRYLPIVKGQFAGKVLPVIDRDPSELRHAGKRFIFSMPEYVAGLQFDTVFLIHADVSQAPVDAQIGIRRKFISNVYLGCSRAERNLYIASSQLKGGRSDIFKMALERGSLVEV
jgi:hypothetical protein